MRHLNGDTRLSCETSEWRYQIGTWVYVCEATERVGLDIQSHHLFCPVIRPKLFLDFTTASSSFVSASLLSFMEKLL